MQPAPRSSIKAPSSADWREKLRQECVSRVEAQRSQLLWSARQGGEQGRRGSLQGALRDIISTASARLQVDAEGNNAAAQLAESTGAQQQMQDDCVLASSATPWQGYDTSAAEPPRDDDMASDDYLELMQALEATLYADLLREEVEYLHSLEQQDIDSMVEAHFADSGVGSGRWSNESSDQLPCPICQDGVLLVQHSRGVIFCPKEHLRLDVIEDRLSLSGLRQRLACMLQRHCQAGCLARPMFEQRGSFGCTTLVMMCSACDAMEVVV